MLVLALDLADEYGIRRWIEALLDPESITHGTSDPKKAIKSPPAYKFKDVTNGASKTPAKKSAGRKSVRSDKAEVPEASSKTPSRKIATPRKPRKSRGKSAEPEALLNGDTARVEIETETKPSLTGEEDVESTKVNIEMPTGHPDLPLPDNASEMLDKAREMVKEAGKITNASAAKGKRKVKDMLEGDDDEAALSPGPESKRQRPATVELRKERLSRRALTGIAVSLGVGYVWASSIST